MRKWFGTDGVRGVANETLTPEFALALAQACAVVLRKPEQVRPKVLIGKDTRRSGDMLEAAIGAGFASMGFDVELLGVVPTPAVAWLVRHSEAAAGVMISASHNPAPDNGIKFFSASGEKLPDAVELQIEEVLTNPGLIQSQRGTGTEVGRMLPGNHEALEPYLSALCDTAAADLSGMRVAIDTAHGAMYQLAPEVLRRLGVQVTVLNDSPDGMNINAGCGSTDLEPLQQAIQGGHYDLGLAFDGDGDRCLAVAPDGQDIDGDQMMYLCARYLPLFQDTPAVVATVMSNLGFEQALAARKVRLLRTQVGDRYVLETLKDQQLPLGGEQSGHIIFAPYQVTGDGLLTAIQVLSAVRRGARPVVELLQDVPRLPQLLKNVRVSAEAHRTWKEHMGLRQAIADVDAELAGSGRLLVRASGTEPKIRVMAEGRDMVQVTAVVDRLASYIATELAD
jgi:phosphoglucosamine mutase